MWVECLDCNAEIESFGRKIYFPATDEGWGELQQYLKLHEQELSHDIDLYVADYKGDSKCPFLSCTSP